MKQYFKLTVSAVALIAFCLLPSLVHAQAGGGCDPLVDPACVPLDGGLSFLIAAGVGYGIKKVRDNRKQQQAQENI